MNPSVPQAPALTRPPSMAWAIELSSCEPDLLADRARITESKARFDAPFILGGSGPGRGGASPPVERLS
eukprot:scaffold134201_cov28-Tisochrysis_lutea.AAC.4